MDDNQRDTDINETFRKEQMMKEAGRSEVFADEEFATEIVSPAQEIEIAPTHDEEFASEIVNPAPVANTAMTGRISGEDYESDDLYGEEFGEETYHPLPVVTYDRKPAVRIEETKKTEEDTEMAGELAQAIPNAAERVTDRVSSVFTSENAEGTPARGKTLGWIGLILAIASLFFLPAVLGPVAAVVGFVAYVRGSRALGVWSVALGMLALLAYLFLVPYYT